MHLDYLQSVEKQFRYYKWLAEKAMNHLEDSNLFWKPNDQSNSIAVIVQHIVGNMKSRWTDFLSSDGEKAFRNRDQEFEIFITERETLFQYWNEGWQCLFLALSEVNEHNFRDLVYIRNQGHTIIEAVNRQLCHYSYHIGQIVTLAKMQSSNWESLSIPKGMSKAYNKETFSKGKREEHFTDKFLDD